MATITQTDQWYTQWFNTPYYHILYKDRDHSEAAAFMQRLTQLLDLKKGASIMDLACGRGRHSMYLSTLGYAVTGVDLSDASIAFAKAKQHTYNPHDTSLAFVEMNPARLTFAVHNMTQPYNQQFDAVFNLFTSFGYFDDPADNLRTLQAIKANLKPDGRAVIDFMNAPQVIENLVTYDEKIEQGITFKQHRYVLDNHICKEISFTDDGRAYTFTERVHALTLADFTAYFKAAGLQLDATYGNYQLEPYDAATSSRLVMVLSK